MAGSLAEPFYLPTTLVADDDALQTTICLKGWRHDSHSLWELRRFLWAMGLSCKKGPYRLILDQSQQWQQDFEATGLCWDRHFFRSRQACKFHGQEPSEFTHDEACATTAGVLVIVVGWTFKRRKIQERNKASHLLSLLLRLGFGGDEAVEVALQMPEAHRAVCPEALDVGEPCFHFTSGAASLARTWASLPGTTSRLSELMTLCATWQLACPSMAAWLRDLVATASESIDRLSAEDGASFKSDALRHGKLGPEHKRRRLDEDLKHAVATQVVSQGRAPNPAAFARADGDLCANGTCKFTNSTMRSHLAACRLSLSKCESLSVAMDASRFGEPAMDHMMMHAWSFDIGLGTWLPPQVSWRGVTCHPTGRSAASFNLLVLGRDMRMPPQTAI